MLNTLVAQIATFRPMGEPTGGGLDTAGIRDWVIKNVVGLLVLGIGVLILSRAKDGNMSRTFNTGGVALVGLIFVVGGAGFLKFGEQISNVIFK